VLTALIEEHRAIETMLDRLEESIRAGCLDEGAFRQTRELLARHYAAETEVLILLGEPKLQRQHEEALEIAERLEESLATDAACDVLYLARRLVAIAQHNIIEEERDVFPHLKQEPGGSGAR